MRRTPDAASRWKDALEVRREIDPGNRFVTPYVARLLGLE